MQNKSNELKTDDHEGLLSKVKKMLLDFRAEWKKGKYYMLKNKEENIKTWKEHPKKWL